MMKKLTLQESFNFAGNPKDSAAAEYWFDDACVVDMDHFLKTLSGIKAKGLRHEFIGSFITYYASKWLPELSDDDPNPNPTTPPPTPPPLNTTNSSKSSPLNTTNSSKSSPINSISNNWMKKRFFVETLIRILPPEKDSIPCNFLLRMLRIANVVGIEPSYKIELEKRISWQLDEASLKEIMIPAFNHTCETLLDVELVLRLVKRYLSLDDALKSASSMIKVAKLVDSYLAEIAVDSNLKLPEFGELAGVLPPYARSNDDGLYRAIDTFLKAHPGVSKEERKKLCKIIDSRKLSQEASLHAAQNERLPVRSVIQVLFSEQAKLNINKQIEWSTGSFSSTRSPNLRHDPDPPVRCLSKREVNAQNMEIKKLKEEIKRLQTHCTTMQAQIDRFTEKKKGGIFNWKWKKLSVPSFGGGSRSGEAEHGGDGGEKGNWNQTPAVEVKTKAAGKSKPPPGKWRKSLS